MAGRQEDLRFNGMAYLLPTAARSGQALAAPPLLSEAVVGLAETQLDQLVVIETPSTASIFRVMMVQKAATSRFSAG